MEEDKKVVEKVEAEIIALGDNFKANHAELRKNYEELKSTVDKLDKDNDPLLKEKLDKLATDISVRQEALEKSHTERLDKIELSMKSMPKEIRDRVKAESSDERKEALAFFTSKAILQNRRQGEGSALKESQLDKIKENLDVDAYLKYKGALVRFLRGPGDEKDLSPDDRKTMIVASDPDGGYLVTPFMSSMIFQRLYEIDPIRELCNVETISSDAFEEIQDTGDAGSGWESETVTTTDTTTPQLAKKRIAVYPLATKPRVSQMLIEDASINVEAWLANKIANRFARDEAEAFITGNGVGKPRGFLSYASGTTWGTVQQVNMGAAATLTADGFTDVKYAMNEYYLNQGTWLMSRSTMAATMKLKDGDGAYIWKPAMIASDPNSFILGLPVRLSPNMPTVTTNSLSVVLGYWKEAYYIIDRVGISIQRDPYTAKPLVEFYARKRVGGDVFNFDAIKIGKVAA